MPNVLNDATILELRPILASLLDPVRLLFFTQKNACPTARDLVDFASEIHLMSRRTEFKADGARSFDLAAEGVFLEIGLTPNSKPLQGLLDFDEFGQIPVTRDQSTKAPGLFAAGDIIGVKEKQISIAVGQGAQAGISVYQYLRENKLTKSKSAVKVKIA